MTRQRILEGLINRNLYSLCIFGMADKIGISEDELMEMDQQAADLAVEEFFKVKAEGTENQAREKAMKFLEAPAENLLTEFNDEDSKLLGDMGIGF